MSGPGATIRSLDLVLYINGTIFGVASAITWTVDTGRKGIYTIDQQLPAELPSTRASITGNVQVFRKHADGGLAGVGITPVQNQLSSERYFFLQALDTQTDSMILSIPKCAVGRQTWTVAAKGVLQGSFDFMGVNYDDDF